MISFQNVELRRSYETDVGAARKAVSSLEASLASEKGAMEVVQARMASVVAEAKQAQQRLYDLEGKAASLEGQVSYGSHTRFAFKIEYLNQ